eukprot:230697-Chlamydomonas_euryale.AAC.3
MGADALGRPMAHRGAEVRPPGSRACLAAVLAWQLCLLGSCACLAAVLGRMWRVAAPRSLGHICKLHCLKQLAASIRRCRDLAETARGFVTARHQVTTRPAVRRHAARPLCLTMPTAASRAAQGPFQ